MMVRNNLSIREKIYRYRWFSLLIDCSARNVIFPFLLFYFFPPPSVWTLNHQIHLIFFFLLPTSGKKGFELTFFSSRELSSKQYNLIVNLRMMRNLYGKIVMEENKEWYSFCCLVCVRCSYAVIVNTKQTELFSWVF